jgi:hypothetical protein
MLDVKMQVLWWLESGERQVDIGGTLVLATSNIRTILKNSKKLKTSAKSTTAFIATKLTHSRSNMLEKIEQLLSVRVEDQTQRHMPVSQLLIMEKAKRIFNHLQEQGEGPTTETFGASRGWFDRFKHRSNLHSIKGEAASADHQAALELPDTFKAIIEHDNCPPHPVFNVGETGLYWKHMPSRTFINQEEKHVSGFKAAKDRFTLLLGGNTSGDFSLKPMLIYHSMTPQAMKGYSKEHLSVKWKFKRKEGGKKGGGVTRDIFQQCSVIARKMTWSPERCWCSTTPLATLRIWTAYDLYFL